MSVPDEIIVTAAELELIRNVSRKYWEQTPCESTLPGSTNPITSSELTALSWMRSVIDFLYQRGYNVYVTPKLDIPDLDPDTE